MKLLLTFYYGGCRGYQKLFMFIIFWTRSLTNVMQILISIHADINIIIKERIIMCQELTPQTTQNHMHSL